MRRDFAIVLVITLSTLGCGDDTTQTTQVASTSTGETGTPTGSDTSSESETAAPLPDMPDPPVGCTVDPNAEAQLRPGLQDDGSTILVNGRLTHSYGEGVLLDGLGVDVALHPSVGVAYVTTAGRNNRRLYVIDRATREILQDIDRGEAYYGMAVSPDGSRLYVSNGVPGGIEIFDVDVDGLVTSVGEVDVVGWTAGMALTPDGATLYVACFDANRITEIDTATLTITRTIQPGFPVWDLLLLPGRNELWATDFADEELAIYDLTQDAVAATLTLTSSPSMMATNADESRVFVSVSGADNLVAIDTSTRAVVQSVLVAEDDFVDAMGQPLPHSNVGSLWFDASNNRLYAARGSDSAVAVLDADTLELLGSIPTSWYPAAIALDSDGSEMVVAELRANGTRSNLVAQDPGVYLGGASFIDLSGIDLADTTNAVVENFRRPLELAATPDCGDDFPLPLDYAGSPVIEHVVLIVNENQTFDALFGNDADLLGVEADPAFLRWDPSTSINKRALAQRFVIADNFYTDAEESDSGHTFLTSTHWTDFVERIQKDRDQYDVLGFYPTSEPAIPDRGNFFVWALDHDKTLRIYGEVVGITATSSQGLVAQFSDNMYPGGLVINYAVKDEVKANYIAGKITDGELAQFTFISLPNDHTNGVSPGSPTPPSMVADNDYGVGIIVDAISHSPFWESTVIIVLQDDPQGSDDHIDEGRSPLLVISPWVRTGYVSHAHYSFSSVFATIERLLGLPPLGRPDASAAPMFDMFTDVPNLAPFDALPREYPEEFGDESDPGVAATRCMDFRGPDRAPGLEVVVDQYLAFRRGELSAAAAEAAITAGLAAIEPDGEEMEEAEEESSAHAQAIADYRALAQTHALPELIEPPASLGPAPGCRPLD
jgi:DNA-binding beta-propeller fold protein YncE